MHMKNLLNQLRDRLLWVAMGGAVILAGTTAAFTVKHVGGGVRQLAAINVPLDETPVQRANGQYTSFAPVVKKVAPGVVKIVTTATIKHTGMQDFPGFNDPFWQHFFGQMMPPQQLGPQIEHGLGSGVIVTKDGYILTNNHVVDGAQEVKVTLQDGREFTAKVIGRDPKSDIAVVKVDAKDLPVVPLADSDKVQVGDIVLAIGNPFGVGQTVTEGIVSATGRGNVGIEDYEDFIQTDAAINPGNSGGALVDVEGRLIGVNTAILSRSGGSQGVGFAIPSDLARNVMDSLVKYGKVTRGYLGVWIQNVTPALAKEFKVKESAGALVSDVKPDGPAGKAGLKDGDVIVEFNGKSVPDSEHLKLQVAETKPGTTVPLKIIRDGQSKSLDVTVKELPGTEQLASNGTSNSSDNGTLNGVTVSDLDAQAREQIHAPADLKGALVTQVDPTSPAAQAGLQQGDVIESINHHPVKSAKDAVRLTENAKDKHTLLHVWNNGSSHYVVVDESKVG